MSTEDDEDPTTPHSPELAAARAAAIHNVEQALALAKVRTSQKSIDARISKLELEAATPMVS